MLEQATPPTDAEQIDLLRTANAMLRVRVKELEELKDGYRVESERLAYANVDLWSKLESLTQKCADLEVWRDQPERARRITQLMEAIVRLEGERDVAEARRAAAAMDAATSVRLMETAQDQRDSAMLQISDAHNALSRAGIESAPHEPHEGCSTQLGHRIRLLVAHVERDERLNDELSAELMRANDELTQLRRHNQNLLAIIGAHTPIAAFDLATTWRAERAHMQERIATADRVLADMVNQYMRFPEGYISHEFMSAQEDAIEYLESIGWLEGGQYERYTWTAAALEATKGDYVPRVSSHNAGTDASPIEETRGGVCPRCHAPLNNVSPGISVVSGGISVCTPCAGSEEILRARSLSDAAARGGEGG